MLPELNDATLPFDLDRALSTSAAITDSTWDMDIDSGIVTSIKPDPDPLTSSSNVADLISPFPIDQDSSAADMATFDLPPLLQPLQSCFTSSATDPSNSMLPFPSASSDFAALFNDIGVDLFATAATTGTTSTSTAFPSGKTTRSHTGDLSYGNTVSSNTGVSSITGSFGNLLGAADKEPSSSVASYLASNFALDSFDVGISGFDGIVPIATGFGSTSGRDGMSKMESANATIIDVLNEKFSTNSGADSGSGGVNGGGCSGGAGGANGGEVLGDDENSMDIDEQYAYYFGSGGGNSGGAADYSEPMMLDSNESGSRKRACRQQSSASAAVSKSKSTYNLLQSTDDPMFLSAGNDLNDFLFNFPANSATAPSGFVFSSTSTGLDFDIGGNGNGNSSAGRTRTSSTDSSASGNSGTVAGGDRDGNKSTNSSIPGSRRGGSNINNNNNGNSNSSSSSSRNDDEKPQYSFEYSTYRDQMSQEDIARYTEAVKDTKFVEFLEDMLGRLPSALQEIPSFENLQAQSKDQVYQEAASNGIDIQSLFSNNGGAGGGGGGLDSDDDDDDDDYGGASKKRRGDKEQQQDSKEKQSKRSASRAIKAKNRRKLVEMLCDVLKKFLPPHELTTTLGRAVTRTELLHRTGDMIMRLRIVKQQHQERIRYLQQQQQQ